MNRGDRMFIGSTGDNVTVFAIEKINGESRRCNCASGSESEMLRHRFLSMRDYIPSHLSTLARNFSGSCAVAVLHSDELSVL